jgi:hypothetical protein
MYKILGSRRQNDFSRAVILHPITLLQQLDMKIRRSSGSYLSAARDSLRDIIAACFVPSPMQVALMATMPWDKIEESQTEPLLGRKLLAGYPGPWLWTPSHLQQCPAAVVMVDDFRFRATQPTDMMITDRAKD